MPLLVLITLFLLSIVGPARTQDAAIRADLAYGLDPAEMLDVCLPPVAGAARPGIVLIHGGGWSGGSRKSMLGYCRELAGRGLVAINIDYRLTSSLGGAWPAQLQDAQLAVRWLRAHAGELGIDPRRICASGNSAGGHLAVYLAVLQRTVPGDRATQLSAVASTVACAVDNFGPVDLTAASPFRNAVVHLAGNNDQGAVARNASPLFLVDAATAPIMIVQGDDDIEMPPAQSAALRDALRRAHVPQLFLAFPGGHEFKSLAPAERQEILQLEAAFIESAPPLSR